MKSNEYDVFISYSSFDNEWADVLKDNLIKLGFSPWKDTECIKLGEQFPSSIGHGLSHSKKYLLIVSPASMSSPCFSKVDAASCCVPLSFMPSLMLTRHGLGLLCFLASAYNLCRQMVASDRLRNYWIFTA